MKIVTVFGARPQVIKAAPLSRLIERSSRVKEVIVHTGQHYDAIMSDVFFAELGVPEPHHNLQVGSGSHGKQTGAMLQGVEAVLVSETPDVVVVYGDTNSTLAGALAGAKLNIPIAHIEAGLRSFNRRMPEEVNRVLTDHVSSFLFCPNQEAVSNLAMEGINGGVHNVGDVMYDCHLLFKEIASKRSTIQSQLGLAGSKDGEDYCLATVHRAENTDCPSRLQGILEALKAIGMRIVLPLHPRTRQAIAFHGFEVGDNVSIVEPMSYLELFPLKMAASVILTDSGGLQKEAYFCGVPCITLRDETEWNETTDSGMNIVAGAEKAQILTAFNKIFGSKVAQSRSLQEEGNAAGKILRVLEDAIGSLVS